MHVTPPLLFTAMWENDWEGNILERHITANLNLTFLQVGRQMSCQQNCRMIPDSSAASSRPPPIIITFNFNFQKQLSATVGHMGTEHYPCEVGGAKYSATGI